MTYFLFLVFQLKHFVVDFLMQGPYQFLNKGTYGHPGGILHSGLHAATTFLIFVMLWGAGIGSIPLAALLAVVEFLIHYHIDWAKVQINKRYQWKPDTSKEFWFLLGLDQLLHQLTYIGLILAVLL